ncbi:hypothetical protein PF001_g5077 [Phytophthora fragariae]|uniref:Uncharacterized protein n=1 Tax=Phytophthora fragariae TaxID=53985 RepID=A0A6A3M5A9_9STRA|nr:hypothetical protein PF011_g2919 [Phytophthora fragariae]KAE9150850.1 hypothetical protein PF006_g4801 [Phytophthora fragariae]KAE9321108.1 hypothetical protein PF001_g5077 [Phytophthora fragariae]
MTRFLIFRDELHLTCRGDAPSDRKALHLFKIDWVMDPFRTEAQYSSRCRAIRMPLYRCCNCLPLHFVTGVALVRLAEAPRLHHTTL